MPFWPTLSGSSKQVVASIAGTSLESQPFDITETHATFLKIYHEVRFSVCLSLCQAVIHVYVDFDRCKESTTRICFTLSYVNAQELAYTLCPQNNKANYFLA